MSRGGDPTVQSKWADGVQMEELGLEFRRVATPLLALALVVYIHTPFLMTFAS